MGTGSVAAPPSGLQSWPTDFARDSTMIMRHAYGYMAFAAIWLTAATGLAATQLTVYTAISIEETDRVTRAFAASQPDIELRWVRDSTDRIVARFLHEIQQPKADIIWGVAASTLAGLASDGYFQPYAPRGFDRLDRRFSDPNDPPSWVGQRVWTGALCVHTTALAQANLKPPARWGDLLDPAYKGLVLALDPGGSRTGMLTLRGWFSLWGEAAAWRYMEGLHRNIIAYLQNGAAPCNLVARGQYPIGFSSTYQAIKLKRKGLPIDVVIPGDGIGWDVEAMAVVRGTPYAEAAEALADWSIGSAAMNILSRGFGMTTLAGPSGVNKKYPPEITQRLAPVDFFTTSHMREKILAEWRIRFSAKATR